MSRTPGTPPRAPTPRELPSAGAAAGAHPGPGPVGHVEAGPYWPFIAESTYLWRSQHDRTPGENSCPVATLADPRPEPRPDHPGRGRGRDLRPGPPPPRRRD